MSSQILCVGNMKENLCSINEMLPELLKSCQFRVTSLFQVYIKRQLGFGTLGDKYVCTVTVLMAGKAQSLPHNIFFLIFPPLLSSLSQPPLQLAASSSNLCIYCMRVTTTEVQRVCGGWLTVTFFILTPTRFTTSRNVSP